MKNPGKATQNMKFTGEDFPSVFYEIAQRMEVTNNCQARDMGSGRCRNIEH